MNDSSRRINAIALGLGARRYLEIGVHEAATFRHIDVAERTGVDPCFSFDTAEVTNAATRCVEQSSNQFFSGLVGWDEFDIVFIDGLHTFEQVVIDLSNSILRTHRRSAILIDDTIPNDVFSTLNDHSLAIAFRKAAGIDNGAWHGDVFKILFYLNDFWPSLNYRTIMGTGNPQTLVWRSNQHQAHRIYGDLESISRATYFDLQNKPEVVRSASEEEAIGLCISELE